MPHGKLDSLCAIRLFPTLLVLAACAAAQVPDKFTNLQVLPKSITRKELMSIMRGFSFALQVRCEFCHAGSGGATLNHMDFAADEKESKRTARVMLRMVEAINHDYLAKVAKTPPAPVECFTCHHGLSRPRTLQSVLAEQLEKHDIPSTIALYRELRKEYYGSGQYDFSETSLNLLSESLVGKDKPKEAVAIMELNLEVNSPPSGWAYNDLATAHCANGETEKAKADYKKILELNPQDSWAREQLEQLEKSKQ
jgi:tetratricopeptide (TPR) repeat protein